MTISRDAVLAALAAVDLAGTPLAGTPLATSGRLSEIAIDAAGRVSLAIAIEPSEAAALEPVRAAAEAAIRAVPGVGSVFVSLTAERPRGSPPGAERGSPPGAERGGPPAQAARAGVQSEEARPSGRTPRVPVPQTIPGVAQIVAVASGKGGVGKSTLACNLALAFQANGLRVGLLDADIYGPSAPKLFGLSGKPRLISGRIIEPLDGYGVKVMSIGFLVEEDSAMIWRGPMVMSAITQMLREVAWGDLDILVVDMPPGTGDAQLTMAQATPLAGAVIVSTPQDLALIDARRGVAMFRKVAVPILGIVENMATFMCPHCGTASPIFGHGGARREAERLGVPFLGEIPLDMALRESSDAGRPLMVDRPDGTHATAFRAIADQVWRRVASREAARPAPRIVIA